MKNLAVLLLVGLTPIVSGCIRLDQTLTLNADSSGSMDISYSLPEQTIAQIKAMRRLREQLDMAAGRPVEMSREEIYAYLMLDAVDERIRREAAKPENRGLTLGKLEIETRNARRYVQMALTFESLEELAKSEVFQLFGFTLGKNRDGQYALFRNANARDPEAARQLTDPATLKLLQPLLGGFRVGLTVKTPGRIIRTTAPRNSLYSAEWVFDFDRNSTAFWDLQNQQFGIVFDSTGLSLPEIRRASEQPSAEPAPPQG